MAEAIIVTPQSGKSGGKEIPIIQQEITESTTWTVPESGRYIVQLFSPLAKGGEGGHNARPDDDYQTDLQTFGAQGGYGGSADYLDNPMLLVVDLNKNDNIECTINTSITSFGNIASISAGTSGQDGTDGTAIFQQVVGRVFDNDVTYSNRLENWQFGNGSGGAGGSPVTYSIDSEKVLFSVTPSKNKWPTNLSGRDGEMNFILTSARRYYNIDMGNYVWFENYVISPNYISQVGNGGEYTLHSTVPSQFLSATTRTQDSSGDYHFTETITDFDYDISGGALSDFDSSSKPGKIIIYSTGLSL